MGSLPSGTAVTKLNRPVHMEYPQDDNRFLANAPIFLNGRNSYPHLPSTRRFISVGHK